VLPGGQLGLVVFFARPVLLADEELDIDLADLNVDRLRNVSPTPANYAQRSGRAGRAAGDGGHVLLDRQVEVYEDDAPALEVQPLLGPAVAHQHSGRRVSTEPLPLRLPVPNDGTLPPGPQRVLRSGAGAYRSGADDSMAG
jgi:hypothetical protein